MKKLRTYVRTGFTLTELMAVVIIIAILSGIAAGTYKKAVERSRFNEGLTEATTIMEAVDRYFYDNPMAFQSTGTNRPKLSQLDIALENQKPCLGTTLQYCAKTKYFKITFTEQAYTEAERTTGDYKIRVYSSAFGGNTRKEPDCYAVNQVGKNMCVSMGYTNNCNAVPAVCSKPNVGQ